MVGKAFINSEQFTSALRLRDLTDTQVQAALCRSNGHLNNIRKRGYMKLEECETIEAFFDIPKEEYVTKIVRSTPVSGGKRKGVEIDGKRLKQKLEIMGYSMIRSSRAIGKSDTYISNCVYKGRINEEIVEAIKDILGIPPEEYVYKYMVKEESELPDIPILIEDKNNPITMVVDTVAFEPAVKAATDIPTPKFSFDRNKLRVLKRPEPKEVETKKSGKFPWGESSETIHNPDMPIFVNITINVDAKPTDGKTTEIDYRRLKSDTYNAVCTGVFDGMARWNRR